MSVRVRAILAALVCAAGLGAAGAAWFRHEVRGSLPQIDGTARLPGLGAAVRVERDGLGVPTIRAQSREDAVRALGYVHGQDRFFQMDLLRRSAAGELAALFGSPAVALDRAAVRHDFRSLAEQAWARAKPEQQRLLRAYAAGVNAGLSSLRVKPFEYLVLRARPEPWRPQDTFLVSYAMVRKLQDDTAGYQRALYDLRVLYGQEAVDFFSPLVGPGDAALDGSTAPLPAVPGAGVIDLRTGSDAAPAEAAGRRFHSEPYGSNAFAVAGRGGAPGLLANDMHLSLMLPNTWYRAVIDWPGHRLAGVTLPGTPAIIAGSNGHIAWGLTDGEAGTADLIAVETDTPGYYLGANDLEYPLRNHTATIRVNHGKDVTVSTPWTMWGPIVGHDPLRPTRLLAMHWTEDDPAATNLDLMDLDDAATVAEAIAVAHRSGVPVVNFVVADAEGRVGWTLAGRLPLRVGYSGTTRWPVSWKYGDRSWQGFLPPDEVPVVTGRPYVWSSNQRMLGGAALAKLGDNGYFSGARAGQVRDDLAALAARAAAPRPEDLLRIQLDDGARFLGWWRDRILELRTDDPLAAKRRDFYDAVADWGGAAATGSVGYRLVREYRDRVVQRVLGPIFQRCADLDADFDWSRLNYEPAVRALIAQQPSHLLDPRWTTWNQLLLAAVGDGARHVRGYTWGRRNTLRDVHPFSLTLPGFLTGWLNLPPVELPGDQDMPRVQEPAFGASERLVVAPGREAEGIFEMPGGESGHPLSPFYRAGTAAWERGDPSPFLPGAAEHALLLQP